MSNDTPETREKNFYQQQRQKLAAAVTAWQEEPDDAENASSQSPSPLANAAALEDCLHDQGLQIMPRACGYGKYLVLVDGRPALYPGQNRPTGPLDADEAAEVFLVESAKSDAVERQIVIRSATDLEMVASVFDHITGGVL
jgi:hypothetical protein